MGKKEDEANEKMVKESFARGDADKDWNETPVEKNVAKASEEPDPTNDLPPIN